jgi:hypothetical protein
MNNEQFIFDIEHTLIPMENIINKYVTPPQNCMFLKGVRLPISDHSTIERFRKNNMISDTPQHPIIAPLLVKEMILLHAAGVNPNQSLLYRNVIDDSCSKEIYPTVSNVTSEFIIMRNVPSISIDDYSTLIGYIDKVTVTMKEIINKSPEYIYDVDISTSNFKLNKLMDVKAFRYQELMDRMTIPIHELSPYDSDKISDTVTINDINALEGSRTIEDCNNNTYIEQYIRVLDFKNIIGKRFLNNFNAIEIVTPNHQYLIDNVIRLRSAYDCKLITSGNICPACAGVAR